MTVRKNMLIPEIEYIADVIFGDFLNINCEVALNNNFYEIRLENGRKLFIADVFFSKFENVETYLKICNVPESVKWMENEFTFGERIPVIFGDTDIIEENGNLICGADILASAFFMLSRWEESVSTAADSHSRFPVEESLAFKAGFLEKPVVNQYVELIWMMLQHLGYKGSRKRREFLIELSHDVDAPYKYAFMPLKKIMKLFIGDLIKRKSLGAAVRSLSDYIKVKSGDLNSDPYNTFNLIMDLSERKGVQSTFFFIAERKNMDFDGLYDIEHEIIEKLIKSISERGHKIGLHASYNSYNCSIQTAREFKLLKDVCRKLKIDQNIWGVRQHFLRWKTPDTFQNIEDCSIDYDTSITFAQHPGFRAGVCYPFPVFNVKTRKRLKLIESPLIIMDCSLISERYLNLSFDEAAEKALMLKEECRKYNGVFSLLWHNNEFQSEENIKLYSVIIE